MNLNLKDLARSPPLRTSSPRSTGWAPQGRITGTGQRRASGSAAEHPRDPLARGPLAMTAPGNAPIAAKNMTLFVAHIPPSPFQIENVGHAARRTTRRGTARRSPSRPSRTATRTCRPSEAASWSPTRRIFNRPAVHAGQCREARLWATSSSPLRTPSRS